MTSKARRLLSPHTIRLITFDCTVRGIEDCGQLEGFWTGDIDTWGKYTIRSTDGSPIVYLFANEIVDVNPIG